MNLQVVPWFNSDEWMQVYKYAFSFDRHTLVDHKTKALKMLRIWKIRCPSLPAGIESTLALLHVQYEDIMSISRVRNNEVLRLAFSSAIMRFVNHMLDADNAKGTSLYKAAKQLGIPEWIIDLRHDTAHNNSLPTLELLREATTVSLDWLHENYWNKYKNVIRNYVRSLPSINEDELKVKALIEFYVTLSICVSNTCKVKKLSDIEDDDMRLAIVTEARDVLGRSVDFSDLKAFSINTLITLADDLFKKLAKNKNYGTVVAKTLVEDSLFLSHEMLEFLDCNLGENRLPSKYVNCFETLLIFLHNNDLILDLIMELLSITQQTDVAEYVCQLAALWICEILDALRKSKLFLAKYNRVHSENKDTRKQKENKLLFKHWYPNEKDGLFLNLLKDVPITLKDLSFIQPIISTYNPYLTYFIKNILILIEPPLPRSNFTEICHLAKLISEPKSEPIRGRVYTVEDVLLKSVAIDSDSDSMDFFDEVNGDVSSDEGEYFGDLPSGTWKVASQYKWSNCPIGVMPSRENANRMEVDA